MELELLGAGVAPVLVGILGLLAAGIAVLAVAAAIAGGRYVREVRGSLAATERARATARARLVAASDELDAELDRLQKERAGAVDR
jgi:sensor histidine kinase regulating citrate/malate metabolism